MNDLDLFIGIPHEYGESTFEHCDCAGLAKLWYKEHGFVEPLDDKLPIGDIESNKHHPMRILRYLLKNLDRIDDMNDLQYGDIVVLRICGENHVGISVDYGKILAMQVPVIYGYSKSTLYRRAYWKQFFTVAFRSRREVTSND